MPDYLVPLLFFGIAFFYSSIGFGGGSSYLAILSLLIPGFYEIRTTALIFNLVVVSVGTFLFVRNKVFDWKMFWPFVICSVPVAFFAAQLRLSETLFFLILGGSLLLSAIFMGLQSLNHAVKNRQFHWWKSGLIGSGIGLLSGVAGIGGGIFLSPTLNLSGWGNSRIVAALASFFILCNSVACLSGLVVSDSFDFDISFALPLVIAVFLGGILGSYLTNRKFNVSTIRLLTALLVGYVGLKLVLKHGFELSI